MQTLTLPDPPSDWMDFSREQLIYIHSLPRSEMPDSVFRMQVFLYLAGLELCGQSYYDQPEESDDISEAEISKQLDWMESIINGTAEINVVLKPVQSDDDVRYVIGTDDLFNAVSFFTKFLDEPYTLIDCKIDTLHLGDRIFKAPDPMMVSLTYEQYQDAQSILGSIWYEEKNLTELKDKLNKIISKAAKKNKEPNIPAEDMKQMQEVAESIKQQQNEFLSKLFLVMDVKTEDVVVLDDNGEPVKDKRGKVKTRTNVYNEARTFNSVEAERYIPNFKEHAPQWLFPIMYQWFQSSLQAQQKNFPKVFSGKKGKGGDDNPFVATISTLNTLMKEQGYQDQQAVLNANAVFIFQKLDALTRQAEEMERMNKKMKSKSRK